MSTFWSYTANIYQRENYLATSSMAEHVFFCGIFEWLFIETICSACKKLTTEDWGHKSIGEKNLSTHSDIHSSSCLKRSKRQSCTPPQRSPQRGLLDGCSWHWGQTIRALHAPCHCESDSTPWFPCHPITWVRQLEWAKCTFNLVLHSLCSNLWVRPLSPLFFWKEKKLIQIWNCIAFSPISQLCEIIDGRLSNWPI